MTIHDTHTHIYLDQFKEDRIEVIEKARDVGVEKMVMPNIDHTTIDEMLEVEESFPGLCMATMGLHPCSVKKNFDQELYIVEDWLSKRKFIAIGETGIDLYWDKTFFEQQREALSVQVRFAKRYQVPIILHTRNSIDETIDIIEKEQDGSLFGVFHCFTGNTEQAKRITELNFYVGVGGVATFKNGGLDKVLPDVDLDRIVLETDSPYLAPVPYRGKRNEPAYTAIVLEKVSEIMQKPENFIASETSANSNKLFKYS